MVSSSSGTTQLVKFQSGFRPEAEVVSVERSWDNKEIILDGGASPIPRLSAMGELLVSNHCHCRF